MSTESQKAVICCIPGTFSRALEGRLRECEVKVAGEQEVIEHLSSEWSSLMETESAEMRPECLKNAFNRFESLEFTVLSSVPGIYSLSDFIRKYPGCKVVFIKQSFKLQDFCSTFRRTDWFSTNFGIRGPELRSFYWIILPLFMRSFFNIDPPRHLFSSPATILYQLDRHELIESAAGSQDAIEAFLNHKVESQNLLKLSLDDDIDDAVRFLGGKINPVGNQDYDKAFSSEYWNRMKIRNTLLMIAKICCAILVAAVICDMFLL